MRSNKFVIGGIAGGVAFFLLGFLAYGVLLKDFMTEHAGTAIGVIREPPRLWAVGLGNLFWGFLLSYVLIGVGKIATAGAGVMPAAIIGLFTAGGLDLVMYGTSNLFDLSAAVADMITFAIISGFSGAAVGAVAGIGKARG